MTIFVKYASSLKMCESIISHFASMYIHINEYSYTVCHSVTYIHGAFDSLVFRVLCFEKFLMFTDLAVLNEPSYTILTMPVGHNFTCPHFIF